MNLKLIRWKLPLTYAGIALITAIAMGMVLFITLRWYYDIQAESYLDKNANAVSMAIAPFLQSQGQPEYLKTHIKLLAFLGQTRIQLMDEKGNLVVDSGIPGLDSPMMVSEVSIPASGPAGPSQITTPQSITQAGQSPSPSADENKQADLAERPSDSILITLGTGDQGAGNAFIEKVTPNPSAGSAEQLHFFYSQPGKPFNPATSPLGVDLTKSNNTDNSLNLMAAIPASSTMYGFDLQPGSNNAQKRSSISITRSIISTDGKTLGTLIFSDGPSIGSEIMDGVARGAILAALVAVLIAAGVGWWISRRMSAPLMELTESTRRMAEGDLSVRAQVTTQDEFGDLAQGFNEMAGRVQEIVASLRRFASDAAHELQTPLTALHTNLELAVHDHPQDTSLNLAWQQIYRLEELSTDLLDLSRIESGEQGPFFESIDLVTLLRETSERYASEAEQAGLNFALDLPDIPVIARGRPDQIQRALKNLMENALKFTQTGGKITAGVRSANGWVTLWVEDDGIGIPTEDMPFLFQRFHRARNVANYPGSGLGLAIVQAIIQKHGGQAQVETLEKGTKFILKIPTF